MADEEEAGERQHFASILRAYDNYLPWALARIARLERDLSHLSERHRQLLHTDDKLTGMRLAAQQNAHVLKLLVDPHRQTADAHDDKRTQVMVEEGGRKTFKPASSAGYVPESDMEKLQSTLKRRRCSRTIVKPSLPWSSSVTTLQCNSNQWLIR